MHLMTSTLSCLTLRHDRSVPGLARRNHVLCLGQSVLGLVRRNHVAASSRRCRVGTPLQGGAIVLSLAALGLVTSPARAQPLRVPTTFAFDAFDRGRDAQPQERTSSRDDGVYGRFNGEVSLAPFVGAAWTQAGMQTELGVSGYYFHTVGLQAKYADGKLFPSGEAPYAIGTVSLALRPLFLYRWSRDLEQGPTWLDLAIDSLTLKIGGYWATKRDSDVNKRGLESELSFGLPLFMRADGPFIGFAFAHRFPKVTHDGGAVDVAASLRFEWSFSLGQ